MQSEDKLRSPDRHPSSCALSLSLNRPLAASPDLTPELTLVSSTTPIAADVRAAQAGDAEAFARLYDQHVSALFAACVGLTSDRQSAAELVQDTFVRAWQALSSFRGDSAFGTWLHRIAVNQMLTEARTNKRRALRVAIEADIQTGSESSVLESAAASGTDTLLRLDLEEAMSRLPAGARAVFVMHDLGGYTHGEIADHLGIAEGTCKAHLFRARRLLRGMLDR
ncbi:MAG: RNA polymerase sigma factor [Gemmatimonadaceae bacterium]|nr:RNA polymerase sigma factor [Gemmatimonadaceae bacterium]